MSLTRIDVGNEAVASVCRSRAPSSVSTHRFGDGVTFLRLPHLVLPPVFNIIVVFISLKGNFVGSPLGAA